MNCELAHERIVLAVYGELADDAAHELDRHVVTCAGCAAERQQVQALRVLAEAHSVAEPDPNLIARSRIRLEEALDRIPPKRWYERLLEKLRNNAASLQHAPIAAVLLLVVGGGAGSLGGYYEAQAHAAKVIETAPRIVPGPTGSPQVEVANISSIVREPNSEFVKVRYNKIVPEEISGSLDDEDIRGLLMLAMENASNAGIRDDSVGLLAAECRAGHGCTGTGIRDALIVALRYDRSAAVRQKALEGLQPYVAQDLRVRDAVLEALLNDSDARIRTNAINVLVPVEADTSVRQVLQSVATTDRNPQIRLVSRQVLRRVPEIQ
jgi:hypothetical protein